jgi:hypothetical protein
VSPPDIRSFFFLHFFIFFFEKMETPYNDIYTMTTFRTMRRHHINACARRDDDPQALGARLARFLLSPYSLDATLQFLLTFVGASRNRYAYDKVYIDTPYRRRCYVVDLAAQTVVIYGPEYRRTGKCWSYDTATFNYAQFAAFFGVAVDVPRSPVPHASAIACRRILDDPMPFQRVFEPTTKYRRVDVAGCVTFRTTNGSLFDAYSWRNGGRRRFGVHVAKLLVGPQTLEAAMQFVAETMPQYEVAWSKGKRTEIVPDRHCCYLVDLAAKTVVVTPEFQEGDETLTLTIEEFATWTD